MQIKTYIFLYFQDSLNINFDHIIVSIKSTKERRNLMTTMISKKFALDKVINVD